MVFKLLRMLFWLARLSIYPNIKEMPLTRLNELEEKMPTVYAKLNERGEWTNELKKNFCGLMLP